MKTNTVSYWNLCSIWKYKNITKEEAKQSLHKAGWNAHCQPHVHKKHHTLVQSDLSQTLYLPMKRFFLPSRCTRRYVPITHYQQPQHTLKETLRASGLITDFCSVHSSTDNLLALYHQSALEVVLGKTKDLKWHRLNGKAICKIKW